MKTKQYCVYILASSKNGVLYVGVTSDLIARIYQHRANLVAGFTAKYFVHKLVYYELHADIYEAIKREKQIKKWERSWKIRLLEESNPEWKDLYDDIVD